jgi:hypothetical protein
MARDAVARRVERVATIGGGGGGGMFRVVLLRWRLDLVANGEGMTAAFLSLDVGLALVVRAGAAGVALALVVRAGTAGGAPAVMDWAIAVADDAPAMRAVVARRMRSFMVVHQSKDRTVDPSCDAEAARGMTRRPCDLPYHPAPGPILQPLCTDPHAGLPCAEGSPLIQINTAAGSGPTEKREQGAGPTTVCQCRGNRSGGIAGAEAGTWRAGRLRC